MFILCLIFLMLLSPSLYFCIKNDIDIVKSLPLTFFTIIIIIYLFGMIKLMRLSVYLIAIISIAFFISSIYLFIRSNKKIILLKKICQPSFVIWMLISCFLIALDHGRLLSNWDEFSHWGDVVKAMFNLNDFSTNPNSLSVAKTYLPAISLFQYFWQIIRGEFIEWYLYLSIHLFIITLFAPFLKNIRWKDIYKFLIAILLIIFVPIIFYEEYYTSTYVDSFVSCIFAYSMASIYFAKKYSRFEILNLSLSLSVMTLSKDIGIVFSIICIFVVLVDILYVQRNYKCKNIKKIIKSTRPVFIFLGCVMFVYILWKINIYMNHLCGNPIKGINIQDILTVILGRDETYRGVVLRNYLNTLSTGSLIHNNLSLNIFAILMIYLLFFYLIYSRAQNKCKSRMFFCIFFLGLFGYIFLMFILYIYMFSEYEALRLASFARYMAIYLQAILEVIVFIIIMDDNNRKIGRNLILLLVLTFIISPVNNVLNYQAIKKERNDIRYKYVFASDTIKRTLKNKKKRIYFIIQDSSGYDYWVLKYVTRDNLSGINTGFSWSLGKKYNDKDIWTKHISPKKWIKELTNNYDYVYLYKVDEGFKEKYGVLFDKKENIDDNKLYKVNVKEEKLELCK